MYSSVRRVFYVTRTPTGRVGVFSRANTLTVNDTSSNTAALSSNLFLLPIQLLYIACDLICSCYRLCYPLLIYLSMRLCTRPIPMLSYLPIVLPHQHQL